MTGQLATSRAGHDRDTLYVIIAEEGDFVYLCDGRLKPPDRPKKKRRKHIQPIDSYVDEKLLYRLQKGEKVYAEEIRYALKQYGNTAAVPGDGGIVANR
ncbi:KOW domain-containing RNA-binding protein [Acetatifactor muris]|uniref:50S ribosomal protein L14e n=1 Tax=Acetatifactor muris TaxID=879566 RepID=A0A2K4ZCQ9_9FIRM|nr:KOW domain-containing RNA-binding protein [Acetatifactor muris]MCR2046665.1 KOW domain-containing RNA-binding protein [Acetatifactor muris]SOY28257.1 hypothetical protein AMURIS_00964 [Acetatifactor muris]